MAYRTTKEERQTVKQAVFARIAPGAVVREVGREMYSISGNRVHARFCAATTGNFRFNLNPNSLRAHYELWICGSAERWYLLPVEVIRGMYMHPNAYPDNYHAEIRKVHLDTEAHRVGYASPSVKLDLIRYFCAILGAKEGNA
jgi:hypothetical protein